MKNKFFVSTLAVGAVSLLTLSPIFAAQESSTESEATINFTQPDDAPEIINPDTNEPMDPQPDGTGQTGPLTLDYVSNIDFGSHEISASQQVYESETKTTPFLQVSDRRGTGEGWSVSAQASSFTSNNTPSLLGSKISFLKGTTQSRSNTSAPEVNQNIELVTDGDAVNVVTAESKGDDSAARDAQGLGSWVVKWNSNEGSNVTLTVPAGEATEGTHTSEITWTLYDGPGQE